MKKVLIVAAGNKQSKKFLMKLAKEVDFIIGVDRGAEDLALFDIHFDVAIGDFDSARSMDFVKTVNKLTYPKRKDFSDTEIAVDYAIKQGFDFFILTQMLGGRLDHTLFNVSILRKLLKKGKYSLIKEEKEEVYLIDKKICLNLKSGEIVSLFPVTEKVFGATTKGLEYELNCRNIYSTSSLTLSNTAVKDKVEISIEKGLLLVIVEHF